MQENKKTSKKTARTKSENKPRRQQAASKRKSESSAARSRVKRDTTSRNTQSHNPRIPTANPRRKLKNSKAYGYIIAAFFIVLGAVLFLMLFTFTSMDMAEDAETQLNLFGAIGANIANIMLTLFGLASFWFSAVCLYIGIYTVCGRQFEVKPSEMIGLIVLLLGSSPLFHLAIESQVLDHLAGGALGQVMADLAAHLMPIGGTIALGIGLSLFGILLVTDTSLKAFCIGLWRVLKWLGKTLGTAFAQPFRSQDHKTTPVLSHDDKDDATSEPIEDISGSLYYEDSTSQLLDGQASDLEERQAVARQYEAELQETESAEHPLLPPPQPQVETQDIEAVLDEAQNQALPSCLDDSMDIAEDADISYDIETESETDFTEAEDAANQPDIQAGIPTEALPCESEEIVQKEPEKQADGLIGIMARIKRSAAPRPRSIKRSHSVPALEPEFEFGSILEPEQIGTTRAPKPVPQDPPPTSVLGSWKPRSIGKKSSKTSSPADNHVPNTPSEPPHDAPENPTVALSNGLTPVIPKVSGMPAPELPVNMTKDLLMQLATEEIDLSEMNGHQVTAVTKIGDAGRLVNALAETEDFKLSDISQKPKRQFIQPSASEKVTAEVAAVKPSVKTSKTEDKTLIPVSAELQALMAESGYACKSKRQSTGMESSFLTGTSETPDSATPDIDVDDILSAAMQHIEDIDRPKPVPAVRQASGHAGQTDETVVPESPRHEAAFNNHSASLRSHEGANSFVVAEEKKRVSVDELLEADRKRAQNAAGQAYQRPPLSLLHYDPASQKGFDAESLRLYADKIEDKLAEYNVQGKVVSICPGPIITRFEYQPAPGTKVAKISSLSDDLMMALEITSIRILAPIPGKNVVGIEIPNERRNTIYLKEIIGSRQFEEAKSILTIALGKDSEGEPVVSDLAKMPHLLVAGSTGSGKSVGINTMLCSLLYNATPDEVKLILVDPKCLELSIYEGIPHLLVPPITTAKETAAALDWACEEMDERYRLLASFGVRNIAGYNEQLKNPTLPRSAEKVAEKDADGNPRYKPMPYIVIVVDEFADLMMVSGKEIETSIARLAQKARAAGIHIILATQRPSTNVITGVIKANFPTRLAFRVFSVVDSRTILDSKGAEALLGMGDSLFLPPNTGILQRVHGAYVSDDEVQSVVSFLSQQRAPEYNLDITTPKEDPGFEDDPSVSRASKDVKFDELYDQALEVVLSSGQPTASYLQRRLDIGFNRAARILEQLEREGVVSAPIGPKKKREILIGHV
ncbi:MAG: DNA translocase FtsK 4TM domain-containing protein [Proteobacteria bacterium]|nr:DNA translocase FtsK 4TM domain-containing protein [Pseudomonadota bacterium]